MSCHTAAPRSSYRSHLPPHRRPHRSTILNSHGFPSVPLMASPSSSGSAAETRSFRPRCQTARRCTPTSWSRRSAVSREPPTPRHQHCSNLVTRVSTRGDDTRRRPRAVECRHSGGRAEELDTRTTGTQRTWSAATPARSPRSRSDLRRRGRSMPWSPITPRLDAPPRSAAPSRSRAAFGHPRQIRSPPCPVRINFASDAPPVLGFAR